jgi:hypothetical protein
MVSLAALALAGCSALLDFDDVEGLPCPCDADHVCLIAANRCVPRGSVDDFKSCSQDTSNQGDDLCGEQRLCQAVNDLGPRCLPRCTPASYALPESNLAIAQQCPEATTCWLTDRGGVCSEGVCREVPNNCAPGQVCKSFNGAGVCFAPCDIFRVSPPPCGGDRMCHPIGDHDLTACVPFGGRRLGELCDEANLCAGVDDAGRAMVCGRPFQSSAPKRCYAACQPEANVQCATQLGESCTLARPRIDPQTGANLGICTGGR